MIDTAALREKVLDLAIRGKLVPQDPNDEPASILLERIHEQKLQMVREGKLKAKDVKDDTIIFKGDDNCYYEKYSDGSVKNIQDEIPFDLPVGWAWSRLKTLSASIQYGVNDSAKTSGSHRLLRITDIQNGSVNWNTVPYTTVSDTKYSLSINDIVFARTGATVGKSFLIKEVPALAVYASYLIRIRLVEPQCANYIYKFFNSSNYWMQITDKSIGVGQPNCNGTSLSQLFIPVPPMNEQASILTIVENVLSLIECIDVNKCEIEECSRQIKSKILELAIQGKLVPQDENDEPASVLLERIRAERKAKLGKKYVESYIYKGDDNCYYENNGNSPIEMPYNLPENWAFSRLEEVAWLEDGIRSSDEELPYLDVKTIRGKQNATILSNGKIIEKGMQVILVDGENSGEVFEVPCRGYMGSTFRILKVSSYVEIDYIRLILDYYKNLFKDNKTGSAIPHLNKKIFKSLIIGIPPIEEQKAIVNCVKSAVNILKDEV